MIWGLFKFINDFDGNVDIYLIQIKQFRINIILESNGVVVLFNFFGIFMEFIVLIKVKCVLSKIVKKVKEQRI